MLLTLRLLSFNIAAVIKFALFKEIPTACKAKGQGDSTSAGKHLRCQYRKNIVTQILVCCLPKDSPQIKSPNLLCLPISVA